MLESRNGDEAVEDKDTLRYCGLGVGIWWTSATIYKEWKLKM
jgi:hypothetical protein